MPQDIVDRVFANLVPQALGLPLEPLAPLDATPLLRKLSSPEFPAAKPVATLGAARYADFLLAWGAARGGSVVPDEPFDPSRASMFNAVTLSGGECRGTNVVLRLQSACEVLWEGAGDAWQSQPDADSDNDSVGNDIVAGAGYQSGRRGRGRGRGRGSRRGRGRGRGGAVDARGREWDSVAEGAVATTSDASSGNSDDGEIGFRRRKQRQDGVGRGRGGRGRGRGGRGPRGSQAPRAPQSGAAASSSSSDEGDATHHVRGPRSTAARSASAAAPAPNRKRARSKESPGSSTDTGYSSHSSDDTRPVSCAGGDPSSTESDESVDRGGADGDADEPAPAAAATGRPDGAPQPTRTQLKATSADRRRRRHLSCDPVVCLQLVFEYRARGDDGAALPGGVAAAQPRLSPPAPAAALRQLVFAYKYTAVPELDAFAELGSRDFSVRACSSQGAVVLPVSSLVRPRRCERVPAEQLPEGWSTATHVADVRRPPEYVWFE